MLYAMGSSINLKGLHMAKVKLTESTNVDITAPDGKTTHAVISQKNLEALEKAHGGGHAVIGSGALKDVMADGTTVTVGETVTEQKQLTQMMQLLLAKEGFSKNNAKFGDDGILGAETRKDAKASGKDYIKADGTINKDAIVRDFKTEFDKHPTMSVDQTIAVVESELQKPHYHQVSEALPKGAIMAVRK